MNRLRPFFIVFIALVAISASFSFGTWFGYSSRPDIERVLGVLHKETPGTVNVKEVDFEPFWRAWRVMEEKYVGDTSIDRQALVWGAIEGMVKGYGDPYSVFFPPKEKEAFDTEIKGEFSGIGAEIGIRKSTLTVIAPLKGSPAEKAGIKAGDKILKINDTFTDDLTLEEAVSKIRGERGSKVSLIIHRNSEDKPRTVDIIRDVIKVPAITAEMHKESGVFTIRLSSFSEKSPGEFSRAVQEFLNSGSNKLVLDLRNNPGGFFSAAVDIASWFIPEGEIVAQEAYRDRESDLYRSRGYKALEHIKTAVLVDRGSASAAEILAGALQEHKKGKLIGEKTFGKGSVQEIEDITPNTSLKVTIARWLTPNGKSISKEGLTPDIEIKIPDDNEPGKDPQFDRAVEYLTNGT